MDYNQTYHFTPVDFDPFAGPELLLIAPATEPQIEIWLSCKIGGAEASCAYNESFTIALQGTADVDALKRSIEALVNRHEALRSVFSADGTKICTYSYLPPDLTFEDLSAKSAAEQSKLISTYVDENARSPFNLVNGPLMRVKIFKQNANTHRVFLTLHHIICDGWSYGVLLQELGKYYSADIAGTVPDLPVAPKYSQYAVEQAAFMQSAEYRDIEQFWLDQYRGNVPVVDLPADNTRPAIRTFASRHFKFTLEDELTEGIKKLAYQSGCSLLTTLLAAFELWLQNTTGQSDVVVGIPAAGQPAIGETGLIGHCVNLLPIKSSADTNISFLAYLKKRRPEILDAYDNQRITFGSLIKKLNINRDSSRVPLIPIVFNSDMGMDEGIIFEGLQHELEATPRRFENFELFININDIGAALNMDWSYNAGLFSEASIIAMMNGYKTLLKKVTANSGVMIQNIAAGKNAITAEEIMELNDTATIYPKATPLHHLISNTAAQNPGKTAVKFANTSLTYY